MKVCLLACFFKLTITHGTLFFSFRLVSNEGNLKSSLCRYCLSLKRDFPDHATFRENAANSRLVQQTSDFPLFGPMQLDCCIGYMKL